MGEQVPQGDGPIGVVRIAKLPPQVFRDVTIQVECAFLHQLHDNDGGEGFGNRCNPHEVIGCECAILFTPGVDFGAPVGVLENHLTTPQDRHREPGELTGRIPATGHEPGEFLSHFVFSRHRGFHIHRPTPATCRD